ncbi:TPA: hypothetical protein ACPGFT_001017 [Haemophilus influenzae]
MSILYAPTFWGVVFTVACVIGFLIGWFDQPPPKVRRAEYRRVLRSYRKNKKIYDEMKKKGLL